MDIRGDMHYWLCLVVLALLNGSYGQTRTATTRGTGVVTSAANSECVILGVDADGFMERIDPKKFLLVDNEQRSYLQRACDNYKKMRALSGCVPQQQIPIYDYACDTVLEMGQTANAACWNRTTSCGLVKLLPPTDSITAAYCKFLTAAGLQLGCALELTPACNTPSNAAISQAAAKGRTYLDTFQCAVLSPVSVGSQIPPNVTGLPIVEAVDVASGQVITTTAAAGLFGPKHRVTEPPLIMKGKLRSCDFGQNARGLICAANLLGVQDKFSETSQSLIFQELAKDNSTDLVEVCQKFDTYYDCMVKNVFQPNGQKCQTKSHVHDFSLLFYAFCDPANQPRIQRIRPCVQKLLNNKDPGQSAAFQTCRENLTTMRAQVRVVIKESQNSVALCRGMLAAEAFFDCIPPIVSNVCDKEAVTELAYFRQWVADNIDTVGCPLNDQRLSNYTWKAAVTQAPVLVTAPPTTPVDVVVKSATIGIIESEGEKPSTVNVDETVPILHVNSVGEKCSDEDIRRFTVCYANISNIDFNPFTIIKKPEQMDAVCEAFDRYQSCRDLLECMPPGGDGLNNMLGFFCSDENNPYKNFSACMQQAAQSTAGQSCTNHVLPRNFLSMTVDQSCTWANDVVNCSYNELLNRCGIDVADYSFKMWQGYAKGINITCQVEPPLTSNETILGTPIACNAAEEQTVEKCIEPFSIITDRLTALIEGGLQAFMRAMRRITEIFKSGCDTRVGFDDCMRKGITKGSKCHVSSCLIKVTEYACNFTGDSDMSLEDRLKCMWSMIGEPEFGKCLKLFPKNAFSNINRLKLYLPRFVNCLESPLLKKCGQTTLNLVKALSSQASTNPDDQTCVVLVPGLNDNGTIAGAAVSGNGKPGLETVTVSAKTAGVAVIGPAVTLKGAPSTPAPVIDTRPLCKTQEEATRLDKCHRALNNRSLEPQPLKVFNSLSDLDEACNLYKDFASCTQSLPCRFEFTAAEQEVLLRVCTVRYDDYKSSADCLISFGNGPKGGECSAPLYRLNLTQPQTDDGQSVCRAVNTMMACINPDLYNQCNNRAMDVVYDLHTAFAKKFKPDCIVKPPVLLTPGTECTGTEVAAFESCLKKANNYSVNPISIIGDPDQWSAFCKVVESDMQTCLKGLTCSPKPFASAYNDTLFYACTSEDVRVRYDKYKSCLGTVLNTAAGQQCVETYKGIQWYGGDDPRGNPNRACKAVSSTLSCAAPEVSQRCEQDAVKFIYDLNQRMMTKIQTECQLVIPQNLPTKLNLTTTTEAPSVNKTIPVKEKEATTTKPNGAHSVRLGPSSLGMMLVSCVLLRRF